MRRRSTALSALAAALLLTAVSAAPAVADDAPPTAAPTVPTTSADSPSAPTGSPTPQPTADLGLVPFQPGGDVVRGGAAGVGFDVSGSSPGATLTVALPAGLTVTGATADQHAVVCAPRTGTVVCDLGAVRDLEQVAVDLQVAADVPIGSHLRVTSTIDPVPGPDANASDNTALTDFVVVGHAVVTQSQSVEQINVPLGGSAPFTITLHNQGPDPATHPKVRFVVQSNDNPKPDLNGFTGTDPDRVSQVNGAFEWTPGTIAVGATISLTITVTATSPAVSSALSFSSSYDGVGEICVNAACLSGAPIRTFVAGTTTPPTGPVLANTGSADRTLTLVAVGLLVAGGGLAAAGRRRRTV